MANASKISIIVPVYNASAFLRDCVNSILRGTYGSFELILVDDGSTDESGELCDSFAAQDCRVRVIHTENKGAADARNTALSIASGDYVAFIDADDAVAPDYLEVLINEIEITNADAAACNFVQIGKDRRRLPVHVIRNRIVSGGDAMYDIAIRREFYWTNVCCKLFRADAIKDLRFPALRYGEDGAFMFDFLLRGYTLALTNYCGYVYNDNSASVTSADVSDVDRRFDELTLASYKLEALPDAYTNVRRAFIDEYARCIHGCAYAISLSRAVHDRVSELKAHIDKLRPELKLTDRKIVRLIQLYESSPDIYSVLAHLYRAKRRFDAFSPKKAIAALIPTKNVILLESYPCFSDSTKSVFDEMIRRGWNKKYRFYWITSPHPTPDLDVPNVSFVKDGSLRLKLIKARARVLISGNRPLPKLKENQYSVFITHGAAIKRMRSYSLPDGIDEMAVLSELLRISDAVAHGFPPSHTYALGLPRNDELLLPPIDTHALFPDAVFDRLVYWLPTYRHHKITGESVSETRIPLIRSHEDARAISEAAKGNGILIVAKPHFADDLHPVTSDALSNLRFIDDDFLLRKSVGNYELLRSADALLTDYSSVYFDYLALDRPIGLIWEDTDEYRAREGFGIDTDFFMSAGEKIYSRDELYAFLRRIRESIDAKSDVRKQIADAVLPKSETCASARVVDRISSKLK